MKIYIKISLVALLAISVGCKDLETVNDNNPSRNAVLAVGTDLIAVLNGGYIAYWQGIHDDHPAMALSITSDTYGVSWGNFAGRRMGEEPRAAYNNRSSESADYKQMVEDPWFGTLSAVSSANDVLIAIQEGITIDNGGPQDQSIIAACHFLRGVSWGYLGMLFDQSLLVDEKTDLEQQISFTPYQQVIDAAISELEMAASLAAPIGENFTFNFFNGLSLSAEQFIQLAHSYSARFLMQWPRTEDEAGQIDWAAVLSHAEQGITYDFAPIADGNFWDSYQKFAYATTGQGPFWAYLDQRLVAALDPSQPTRYPEVSMGETPLQDSVAVSDDARLASDFVFVGNINLPIDRGEWHFSHYRHNRNVVDPTFAGDGASSGPMPVFRQEDNELIKAEALLNLNRMDEALAILNAGARVTRGQLPPLDMSATFDEVEEAIIYERAIELLGTAPMGLYFDRRRIGPRLPFDQVDALGGLQLQTPAQLPVPADEMEVREEIPYNFGGAQDPNGVSRF